MYLHRVRELILNLLLNAARTAVILQVNVDRNKRHIPALTGIAPVKQTFCLGRAVPLHEKGLS